MNSTSMRSLIALLALAAPLALPAREASEQYRGLLAAIAYQKLTIGVSNELAYGKEGGFEPFFLGFNACTRTALGAPFTADTELLLIYSVHGGSILGLKYTAPADQPEAVAPLAAIKAKIEAIYKIALPEGGEGRSGGGDAPLVGRARSRRRQSAHAGDLRLPPARRIARAGRQEALIRRSSPPLTLSSGRLGWRSAPAHSAGVRPDGWPSARSGDRQLRAPGRLPAALNGQRRCGRLTAPRPRLIVR